MEEGVEATAASFCLCLWETSSKSTKDKLTANYAPRQRGKVGAAPFRGPFIKQRALTPASSDLRDHRVRARRTVASNKHPPHHFLE